MSVASECANCGGTKEHPGAVENGMTCPNGWHQPALIPADRLSEREEWAVRLASHGIMLAAEKRELLDFLGYPEPMPRTAHGDLAMAVVTRILEARARGEHIA